MNQRSYQALQVRQANRQDRLTRKLKVCGNESNWIKTPGPDRSTVVAHKTAKRQTIQGQGSRATSDLSTIFEDQVAPPENPPIDSVSPRKEPLGRNGKPLDLVYGAFTSTNVFHPVMIVECLEGLQDFVAVGLRCRYLARTTVSS